MRESTGADEELRQRLLTWVRRNHLGSEPQLLAAARAAVEAASRGATSEDAARAAREAAAVIPIATSGGRPDQNQANAAIQPKLSPSGVTWEMATEKAGQILASLPLETKLMGKPSMHNPDFVTARTSPAGPATFPARVPQDHEALGLGPADAATDQDFDASTPTATTFPMTRLTTTIWITPNGECQ